MMNEAIFQEAAFQDSSKSALTTSEIEDLLSTAIFVNAAQQETSSLLADLLDEERASYTI